MNREKIISRLKTKINDKRFEHSLGVEYTAACMAMVHGADVEKARLAGLLHDCAKGLPTKEKLEKARRHGLAISKYEEKNPDMLHAKLGAHYARYKYDVTDQEVLDAICYHTTGRPNMSLLEKIIFVADFISDERDYNGVEIMREKAVSSLDEAIVEGLSFTIKDLIDAERLVHPDTLDAYNDSLFKIQQEKK